MNAKSSTRRIALSGILVALASILSFIIIYRLPYGGSVTLFSMLPVMLLGYIYGAKWGLFCGIIYGAVQALLGTFTSGAFAGQNFVSVLLILFFDYIAAFAALGTAGVFKKAIRSHSAAFALGCASAGIIRFLMHFISGAILYGSYAEWYFTQEGFPSWGEKILGSFSGTELILIYSAIYNASYMLPEIILTVIGASALIPLIIRDKRIKETLG